MLMLALGFPLYNVKDILLMVIHVIVIITGIYADSDSDIGISPFLIKVYNLFHFIHIYVK